MIWIVIITLIVGLVVGFLAGVFAANVGLSNAIGRHFGW